MVVAVVLGYCAGGGGMLINLNGHIRKAKRDY